MPKGSNPLREKEYEELVQRFKEEGRYAGREEEVAARIVNKQRALYGETREEERKDRTGASPDRGLPIAGYQQLTADEIGDRLEALDRSGIERILEYEQEHLNRKTVIAEIERRLGELEHA